MNKYISVLVVFSILGALVTPAPAARPEEPEVVVVQHLLIGFKRTLPKKGVTRTKKEAMALAEDLLRRAREGEDFDALVREHTDDSHPGLYTLTNRKAPVRAGTYKRDDMVPSFGDVAFSLKPGEIGMAKYSASGSPYGWHVIKRIE